MSKINIAGIVSDISTRTTYLTPIVEAVCNSIDAIGYAQNGKIDIVVKRAPILPEVDTQTLGEIIAIDIIDNGVGFTNENRESFDTYRSGMKFAQGGKGFGRFMYLKYFDKVSIESTFREEDEMKCRNFVFGTADNIIENEKIEHSESEFTGTTLHLAAVKKGKITDKGIDVIARKLVEKLLVYFVDKNHPAPLISIKEVDDSNTVILNNYIGSNSNIISVGEHPIELISKGTGKVLNFTVQVYKVYYSQTISRICLTAHKREVTGTPIHTYIPEFKDTLFEVTEQGQQKNYSVKAYILGKFLDENVSIERNGFTIKSEKLGDDDSTVFSDITESQVEQEASKIVKELFSLEMSQRFAEKKAKVVNYVLHNAPWNKTLLNDIDLESMPMGISDMDLEMRFQKAKYEKEQKIRLELNSILLHQTNPSNDNIEDVSFTEDITALTKAISNASKADLVHYVCTRKKIIELFDTFRSRKQDGTSHLEEEMHNLIFPKGKNSNQIDYEDHNLWLLDERLVFTRFTASDQSNFSDCNDAPDIVSFFDHRVMYRDGDNQIISPVCIVEFKRPKRTNYSDAENPITQACRYARKIQEGKYELPDGLEKIKADKENTPIYIYVVCDAAPKIEEFADLAGLTKSPDGERYFGFMPRYNAYIEVMSYRSLIEHAKMRNAIFFKKLGLL